MYFSGISTLKWVSTVLAIGLVVACSDSDGDSHSEPPEPEYTYSADIVWTEYGIPHISAPSWAGLGYGVGYAYAQQNYCRAMLSIVRFNGELSRYFGPANISDDVSFKLVFSDEEMQRLYFDAPDPVVIDQLEGYAAGLNRYLAETGVDNLPEGDFGCRGEEWVREVTAMDLAKVMHSYAYANQDPILGDFIANVSAPQPPAASLSPKARKELLAKFDRAQYVASISKPPPSNIGSNAYAVGGDASQNGRGLVLANPHLGWNDTAYMIMHLTMGDEYNAMGVNSGGYPQLHIGFNENLAWSTTFSYGNRFMFYELDLNPANPMQYYYDGELRDIEMNTLQVEYLGADGKINTFDFTYYASHYGVILDPGGDIGGWPNPFGKVMTVYNARRNNNRSPAQLTLMAQANTITEFKDALRAVGLPSLHVLAADREGDAFYGDISATPNITQSQIEQCSSGELASIFEEAGYPLLNGSDSACAPGNDPDTAEGIRGFENLPQIDTREYVANANQGFWMINPRIIIDEFPDYMGGRASVNPNDQLSVRPRQLFLQAEERLNGQDDLGDAGFSVDNLRELLFGSRSIQTEHLNDELVEICSAVEDWSPYSENPARVAEACNILASWDQRYLVDSVGAHIFHEYQFRRIINRADPFPASLYRVEFDPSDPFNTPRGIIRTEPWLESTNLSLAESVDFIVDAGVELDSKWGDVQYTEKGEQRYPLNGGSGDILLNVVDTTDYSDFDRILDSGYIANKSDAVFGATYVSVVGWDETDCPDAYGILAMSQSSDPDSPHFADSTELFSENGWINMPFCEQDIEAQELRRETIRE